MDQLQHGLIGLQMYESWIYDENQPFIYVECNETYAFLKKMVETDYFEKLIEKYVLNRSCGRN